MHSLGINKKFYSSFVKECKKYSTNKKLLIPCLEDGSNLCHILLIGAPAYTKNAFDTHGNHLTVLAHPYARGYHKNKIKTLDLEKFDGVEIWNLLGNSKKYPSLKTLKLFKNTPEKVKAYIGLDEHPPFEKNDAIMFVESKNLKEGEVLDSLKKGRFYSKINEFTITNQGEIKRYGKKLNTHIKIKCFIRESIDQVIFFMITVGDNITKRLSISNNIRHNLKKIVNKMIKNI